MRYQVPQFIEVEDKIFGPFTLKQFLYLAGGAAIFFILINFLGKFFGIIVGAPIAVFFLALAFYKPNNRPFAHIVENAFKYLFSSKLYLWNKKERKPKESAKEDVKEYKKIYMPKMSQSKLKDISWGIDVKERIDKEI